MCPDGTFGADCTEDCLCYEDRVGSPQCNSQNGACNCLPGYTGFGCEKGIIMH